MKQAQLDRIEAKLDRLIEIQSSNMKPMQLTLATENKDILPVKIPKEMIEWIHTMQTFYPKYLQS